MGMAAINILPQNHVLSVCVDGAGEGMLRDCVPESSEEASMSDGKAAGGACSLWAEVHLSESVLDTEPGLSHTVLLAHLLLLTLLISYCSQGRPTLVLAAACGFGQHKFRGQGL